YDHDLGRIWNLHAFHRSSGRLNRWLNESAAAILHRDPGHGILLGVRQLDVPDSAWKLPDLPGDASVALASDACRPVDGVARTNLVPPRGTHGGQIAREDIRRT